MQATPIGSGDPETFERTRARIDRFRDFAARYREDASLRARLDGGDAADALAEIGIDLPPEIRARFVSDTPETTHFVLPPDPNIQVTEESLNVSAGGKTSSTIGTAASFGTAGTVSTTVSTGASVGSLGSAGTMAND